MSEVSTRGHKVHVKSATGVGAPAAVLARMSASMHVYTTAIDKADGAQYDTCPTCGGHAETNARTDTTGHSYELTCRSCHWSIPLTRPPTAAHDDARLVTDGGTAVGDPTDGGPQSAQEILEALSQFDSVARVINLIDGDGHATGADVRATLEHAEDRLCLAVDFRTGTEYVWLADGWAGFVAQKVRPNGDVLGPIVLSTDDLEYRLERPLEVLLADEAPVARPENGGGA